MFIQNENMFSGLSKELPGKLPPNSLFIETDTSIIRVFGVDGKMIENPPIEEPVNLSWDFTSGDNVGEISKNGLPFLHDFTGAASIGGNPWFRNLFIGHHAGNYSNGGASFQGALNVGVGSYALNGLTTGQQNNMVGTEAGALLTTGSGNNGIGDGVLYYGQVVNYNHAFGKNCLQNLTTGDENIAFGHNSGFYAGAGTGTNLINGSNHILIGQTSRPSANGTSNEIAIGLDALGKGSNTATFGGPTNTVVYLTGKANISNVPTYADDAAAGTGGLAAGDIYATVTGEVRVKL